MKDMHSDMKVVVAIGAAALAADNTPAAVDLAGYEAAELVLAIGVGGITFDATNKVEFTLTDSEDDATYAEVVAADVLGEASVGSGGIIKSLIAAHAAAAVYRFGYVGGKRYVKLLANFSGTHVTATPLAATWVLGAPRLAPVANQA